MEKRAFIAWKNKKFKNSNNVYPIPRRSFFDVKFLITAAHYPKWMKSKIRIVYTYRLKREDIMSGFRVVLCFGYGVLNVVGQ